MVKLREGQRGKFTARKRLPDDAHPRYPRRYRHVSRFPKNTPSPDAGVTPDELFREWIAKKQPATSSIENWRYVFLLLEERFPNRTAASILPEEADARIQSLFGPERQAKYVKNAFLTACRTVFALGVRQKRILRNPFKDVVIELPRKATLRPKGSIPRSARAFSAQRWLLQTPARLTTRRSAGCVALIAFSKVKAVQTCRCKRQLQMGTEPWRAGQPCFTHGGTGGGLGSGVHSQSLKHGLAFQGRPCARMRLILRRAAALRSATTVRAR
jgi:hypothetical protein